MLRAKGKGRDARCLHDDSNAHGPDGLVNGHGDLFREAFLDLEPAGEGLCYPRELREAEDELVWDVPDGDLWGGGGTLAYGVSQYKREGKKGLPCQ